MNVAGHFSYWVTILLMMAGLYIVIARGNLVKKLVGLSHLPDFGLSALHRARQADRRHGADRRRRPSQVYSNPLPHVLILTAIVVGVATLALGLALVVRIREAYGSIEEDEILAADRAGGDARVTCRASARARRWWCR